MDSVITDYINLQEINYTIKMAFKKWRAKVNKTLCKKMNGPYIKINKNETIF